MSDFFVNPCSLILSRGEAPPRGCQINRPDGLTQEASWEALPHVVWLGEYLHERAHWVQLFTTFFGAAELLKHEMQFLVSRSMLADEEAKISQNDVPLFKSKSSSPYVHQWMALEAFGALLSGERPKGHFDNELVAGERSWLDLARSGCMIFSNWARNLAKNSFKWDDSTLSELGGMELREISLFRTSDGYLAGASTVAELHAEIAASTKVGNFLETQTEYSLSTELNFTGRSSEARQLFYTASGLKPSWVSEVVCSLAAHASLSAPALLFIENVEGENFDSISPLGKFAWCSQKVRPLSGELQKLEAVDAYDAFPEILRLLELHIGESHHFAHSKVLADIFSSQDYGQTGFREPDLSLGFIAHNLCQAGEVAMAQPLFATCPGHEYVIDRGSFHTNFLKISNILEWHGGQGLGPAPKYSERFDADEYVFQLAHSFQKELCRSILIGSEAEVANLVKKYTSYYHGEKSSFKELNSDAVLLAVNNLDMPKNLRRSVENLIR